MSFEVGNGTMPARGFDWDSVGYPPRPVRDFARLHYGKALREPDRRPGSVPVFGTNGPCGWHDEPLAEGPGVILGRKGQGHLGVKWCRQPFWVIDTAYYAEINRDEADLRWFYYITEYVGLDHLKTGEKPGLNRDVFGRQVFPFPPIEDQREIVRILSMLDDKIELNRQINATLEGMAQALFKSWFVDFDPVTAKVAGRQPFGMSSDIAELFPDSFDDSPIGPIPTGWSSKTVPEVFDVNPKRRIEGKEPAPYLDMQRMPTDAAVPDCWITREPGSGLRFQNGDTLLARITPCLENGKTAFVNFLEEGQVGWGSTEYIVLRSRSPLPVEFSYLLARDEDFRSFAIARMTGSSGRQRVPVSVLEHYAIAIPREEIAKAFGRIVHPMFVRMLEGVNENSRLADVRDAVLPLLLSGEIRLRDAEKLVEEVA